MHLKSTLLALAAVVALTAPLAADPQPTLPAGCPALSKREALYRVCEDQGAMLAAARAAAKGEGKLVLAVFGATWCPSCKVLHKQMNALLASSLVETGLAKTGLAETGGADVRSAYVAVEIAVSTLAEGRRETVATGQAALDSVLARAPGAKVRGVPFLAVIDPAEGGKVVTRNLDDMEGRDGFDTDAIARFLATAERHVRHGAAAPSEPGWLARKLGKLWSRS